MKLSLREKRNFYHELGRLIRSGRAFPSALELMLENTGGSLRRFLRALHEAALRGETVEESFAKQRPGVTEMEISILSASERAGRLEHACAQLSSYFGALDQARGIVIKRSLYPAFILHFGIFVLAAPKLALGGTVAAYLRQTFGFLLLIYVAVLLLVFLLKQLTNAAQTNVAIDAALRTVPMVGKMRRAFALARFTATYEAQLSAGVNVLDTLTGAAQASQSALVRQAAREALPQIRTGAKVGPLLENARVFPASVARAFRLAEETGELDEELQRLTREFESEALSRIETLSDWLPKIIYMLVVVYLAYQMIGIYQKSLSTYTKLLDS